LLSPKSGADHKSTSSLKLILICYLLQCASACYKSPLKSTVILGCSGVSSDSESDSVKVIQSLI